MREMNAAAFSIVLALALVGLVVPGISAAVSLETPQITPFITYPDISVTNNSLTNHTLPAEFRETPTLLNVGVELPESALPASKGEMAAGPRVIGFSTDPVSLAILVIAACLVVIGAWCVVKKKRDEEKEE